MLTDFRKVMGKCAHRPQECITRVPCLCMHGSFSLRAGECHDHSLTCPRSGNSECCTRWYLQLQQDSAIVLRPLAPACLSMARWVLHLSSPLCATREGGGCTNGVRQHFRLQGEFRPPPALPADAFALVNVSLSYIV